MIQCITVQGRVGSYGNTLALLGSLFRWKGDISLLAGNISLSPVHNCLGRWGVLRRLSVVFHWLKTDFKQQSWSGCWSGSTGLYIEIPLVPKECVSLRSLGVGRNVNANTVLKTQYHLTAVVPEKDESNEKAGHQPAARYHATHSSRVRHTIFPAACLLFSFAIISLKLTACIYSIVYKHTLWILNYSL